LSDRTAVAPDVEATQQDKCIGDLLCSRLELRSLDRMHGMESAYLQLTIGADSLPIGQQGIVAERE